MGRCDIVTRCVMSVCMSVLHVMYHTTFMTTSIKVLRRNKIFLVPFRTPHNTSSLGDLDCSRIIYFYSKRDHSVLSTRRLLDRYRLFCHKCEYNEGCNEIIESFVQCHPEGDVSMVTTLNEDVTLKDGCVLRIRQARHFCHSLISEHGGQRNSTCYLFLCFFSSY